MNITGFAGIIHVIVDNINNISCMSLQRIRGGTRLPKRLALYNILFIFQQALIAQKIPEQNLLFRLIIHL